MTAVMVATISAVASLIAAVIAGVFAVHAKRLEARLQLSSSAHERVAEQKSMMYDSIIDMFEYMFDTGEPPTAEHLKHKKKFDAWVPVYGSDGVVEAYTRYILWITNGAPGDLQFRLYGDFLLEIRKDVGDPNSRVSIRQALQGRLGNLAEPANLTDPLEVVCRRLGWQPPK
ncbi:hypothetical protein [Promicromonospora soli]